MSNIHYFQRYNHKENVVTNNTLLLLSRLYNESHLKFELFLSHFLDGTKEESVSIGLQFHQLTKGQSGSIPEGSIFQKGLKIEYSGQRELLDELVLKALDLTTNHYIPFKEKLDFSIRTLEPVLERLNQAVITFTPVIEIQFHNLDLIRQNCLLDNYLWTLGKNKQKL